MWVRVVQGGWKEASRSDNGNKMATGMRAGGRGLQRLQGRVQSPECNVGSCRPILQKTSSERVL
jgi:hypothetical protein